MLVLFSISSSNGTRIAKWLSNSAIGSIPLKSRNVGSYCLCKGISVYFWSTCCMILVIIMKRNSVFISTNLIHMRLYLIISSWSEICSITIIIECSSKHWLRWVWDLSSYFSCFSFCFFCFEFFCYSCEFGGYFKFEIVVNYIYSYFLSC